MNDPLPSGTESSKPEIAVLALTSRCNSRCIYCDSWRRPIQEAPLPELLDMVEQIRHLGVPHIHVGCGEGEELMLPHFPQFVRHVLDRGLTIQFQTNGILATRQKLEPIVEMGPMHITLSLDSFNPSIYERVRGIPFERARAALDTLLWLRAHYAGLSISVTCVVSALNLSEITDLIRKLHDVGVCTGLQPYHAKFCSGPSGLSDLLVEQARQTELTDIFDQVRSMKREGYLIGGSEYWLRWLPQYLLTQSLPPKHQCRAGYNVLTIDSLLNIRSCWMLGAVGNLRSKSLRQIWHSPEFAQHRQRMLGQDCPGCWLASYVERWQV